MSGYLVAGIVQEVIVYKEMLQDEGLSLQHVNAVLEQELNLDYYEPSEDQDGYYWHIKPECLTQDLAKFLEAQFAMYTNKPNHDMQLVLEELRSISGVQILQLAASKNLVYFQAIDNIIDSIRVSNNKGSYDYVEINYSMIAYFIEGKIIMETYDDIFRYFENNIRLQKELYPIAGCVKVKMTS